MSKTCLLAFPLPSWLKAQVSTPSDLPSFPFQERRKHARLFFLLVVGMTLSCVCSSFCFWGAEEAAACWTVLTVSAGAVPGPQRRGLAELH